MISKGRNWNTLHKEDTDWYTGGRTLLTEENLWFFVLPLKNTIPNVRNRKGTSRIPVLLSKSAVRSSNVSSSLVRRIHSTHILCNFHKTEKKRKKEKGLPTQPLSPRPPSPFISPHMSLTHLAVNMDGSGGWLLGLWDATSLFSFSFPTTLVSILPPFSPLPLHQP
jgi:hypothetical protein